MRVRAGLAAMALLAGACSTSGDDPSDRAAPPDATSEKPEVPPDPTPSEPSPSEPPEPEPEPAPDPSPPPPPPVPAGRDEVIARVEGLLAAAESELDQATLALLVTDAYGRELGARAADTSVIPASTLKVVTAASALTALGPDARLTTRVDATAPIGPDGTLDGDLVLVGSGDPTLATPEYGRWIYPARPRTPLEQLADQLVEAGLRRLTGGVRGTAPGFAGPSEATGWPSRYFSSFDARYISGLTVDGGLATSIRWPVLDEQRAEERAEGDDTADPESGESTEDPPEPVSIPLLGTREEIEQRLAGLDPPLARVEMAPDPRRQAARELARLLAERDVEIDGEAGAANAIGAPESSLASVDSPPLADILRFMVQRSDNHLADQLFQVVGHGSTGAASWDRSERAVRAILAELGLDPAGTRFADGSGLSRDDRVTPRLLVDLDRTMWDGPHAETWASLQAIAGESGTLRQRLRGTPAAGRLVGKTGTLNDVTALTGAVVGDDGERYHLAVVGNGAEGADRWVVRALMDELALVLVADLLGCRVRDLPEADDEGDDSDGANEGDDADGGDGDEPATGPLGRPPTVVVC